LSAAAASSGAVPRQTPSAESTDRLALTVFAALVVACFAAFFITQRLKHTPTVVQRFFLEPFFAPIPSGVHKVERISFRIKQSDEVTVTVIDAADHAVALLAHDRPLARYTQLSLTWNGRTGKSPAVSGQLAAGGSGHAATGVSQPPGSPAPAGEYRVRVTLRHADRTVISPHSFKLVRKPRHLTASGATP
jgi:hypothetical protein